MPAYSIEIEIACEGWSSFPLCFASFWFLQNGRFDDDESQVKMCYNARPSSAMQGHLTQGTRYGPWPIFFITASVACLWYRWFGSQLSRSQRLMLETVGRSDAWIRQFQIPWQPCARPDRLGAQEPTWPYWKWNLFWKWVGCETDL